MTLYAVLSDIHANYPALLAVARDARDIGRREDDGRVEFACLGDVVDYGPQPNECVAWVRRYAAVTLQGNHDRVAAEPLGSPPMEIEANLWPILLWTRAELRDGHKQALRRWRHEHGASALLAAFTPFHSDVDESDIYVDNPRAAGRSLQRLPTPYGLFGHTHVQGYYVQEGAEVRAALAWPGDLPANAASLPAQLVRAGEWFCLPGQEQRALLNPGSVGQPRQHRRLGGALLPRDYRAAYMLLRQRPDSRWEARFQRVDYPIAETIGLLRERARYDVFRSRVAALAARGVDVAAPAGHPFSSQLQETLDTMEIRLPTLVDRLIDQLAPPETRL